MGFLVEYKGGIDVEDYKLEDFGNGNGFGIRSEHCQIMNDFETRVHKGLIELTTDTNPWSNYLRGFRSSCHHC